MVCLRTVLTSSLAAFSCLRSANARVLEDSLAGLGPAARHILRRTTPAAPHFVAYSDKYATPPSATEIDGFNVFALSFLTTKGSASQAQEWQSLSASQRTTILNQYKAAGISLIVSAFGYGDTPTTSGLNAIDTANTMASWVQEYGLVGIDVDYEDYTAFSNGKGSAEQWVGNFTKQLRTKLPQGQYILTHAPVAPWFSPNIWAGGGYLWVNQVVGSMIDWYNIQFYNQGSTEYTTCDGLLYNSSTAFPQSALFEIAKSGVSMDKLVIGKPATTADATNGYMTTSLLASCVSEAHAAGWTAGVMVWQYPDATSAWIASVRGNTWPVSTAAKRLVVTTSTASPSATSKASEPPTTSTALTSSMNSVASPATSKASPTTSEASPTTPKASSPASATSPTSSKASVATSKTPTPTFKTVKTSATTSRTPTTNSAASNSSPATAVAHSSVPTVATLKTSPTTSAKPTATSAASNSSPGANLNATPTTSTTPSTTANCAGVEAWQDYTAYVGGEKVTYARDLWTASYWNYNAVPGGHAGVWINEGECA